MRNSSVSAKRLPGEHGVWVFVLIDMSFFGVIFAAFAYERAGATELFFRSQRSLDMFLGLLNTVLLLTSSWVVALATNADPAKKRGQIRALFGVAALCGAVFAAIKAAEYVTLVAAGLSPVTNDFFMFYFFVTFIHLLHVLAGVIVLAVVVRKRGDDPLIERERQYVESAATYWHMVDLLWVIIFPMFYLVSWR